MMVQRYNKNLVNLQILCNFAHDDTHFVYFAGCALDGHPSFG